MSAVSSIFSRAEVSNDKLTPEMVLLDALEAIRTGRRPCNKVLVICIDDKDETFTMGFYAGGVGGLRMSEQIALCEMHKARCLTEMGFLE